MCLTEQRSEVIFLLFVQRNRGTNEAMEPVACLRVSAQKTTRTGNAEGRGREGRGGGGEAEECAALRSLPPA
jgi:hypothetical protein